MDISENAELTAVWQKALLCSIETFRKSAKFAVSNHLDAEAYLSFSTSEPSSENGQLIDIGWAPGPRSEINELVRVNLDMPDNLAFTPAIIAPLREQLEPFIEGVGKISLHDIPEGFVIRFQDFR